MESLRYSDEMKMVKENDKLTICVAEIGSSVGDVVLAGSVRLIDEQIKMMEYHFLPDPTTNVISQTIRPGSQSLCLMLRFWHMEKQLRSVRMCHLPCS